MSMHATQIGMVLAGLLATFASRAEPVINTQPTSLAILLTSNATFRVTASGTPPLAYQWRLDGRELAGATNATLVVSKVSLADLGSYTVAARDPIGETVSQPAWLKLARWTELVVFGDSECMAQYSNGPSWVDYLGELLSMQKTINKAGPGATTVMVRSQISQYLSANTLGTNTLLAPWWAGVSADLCVNHLPVAQVVSNYASNLSLLAKAGGRFFILPTVAPLYQAPLFSSDAYVRSIDYVDLKARMDVEMQRLQTEFGLTLFRLDVHDLMVRLSADPTGYGFTNYTQAASACVGCDRSQYLWWDGVHFTTTAHRWIATEMHLRVTPPVVMLPPMLGSNQSVEVQWHGGSPPFRLQSCQDLAAGAWQSGDSGFATNATVVSSSSQQFFRILDLGQ